MTGLAIDTVLQGAVLAASVDGALIVNSIVAIAVALFAGGAVSAYMNRGKTSAEAEAESATATETITKSAQLQLESMGKELDELRPLPAIVRRLERRLDLVLFAQSRLAEWGDEVIRRAAAAELELPPRPPLLSLKDLEELERL